MSLWPRRRRTIITAIAALVMVVGVTGCSPEWGNTKQWLSQQPGVVSVEETEGAPPLLLRWAWSGTLRAEVEPGMDDAHVLALAETVAERVAAEEADWMSVELADGPWAFRVGSAAGNVDALARLRTLQSEGRVTGARIRDDFLQLFAARADSVDVYRTYQGWGVQLLVSADDEVSASITDSSSGTDCTVSPALDFAEQTLSDPRERPSSWYLSIDPCGYIEYFVPFDGLIASAHDIRDRWESSPSPDDISITVRSSPAQATSSNPRVSLRISGVDEEALAILEVAMDPRFGAATLHAYADSLSLWDTDRTVCELLPLVQDAPGLEQYADLRLDGEQSIGVSGPRQSVIDYVEAHSLDGDCTVTGQQHLEAQRR